MQIFYRQCCGQRAPFKAPYIHAEIDQSHALTWRTYASGRQRQQHAELFRDSHDAMHGDICGFKCGGSCGARTRTLCALVLAIVNLAQTS